jgi:hypothetical protein
MKHIVRVTAHWALLIHIYVSMAGLTLAMLFGATGLALNHQDFGFSSPQTTTSEIVLDKNLLAHRIRPRSISAKSSASIVGDRLHDDPDQLR